MKNRLSKIAYTAFCFIGLVHLTGCSTLYEPAPNAGQGTNTAGLVQPSQGIVDIIRGTGHTFGTLGDLVAGAVLLALSAGSYALNKRATSKALATHEEEMHSIPLSNLVPPVIRDALGSAVPGPVTG